MLVKEWIKLLEKLDCEKELCIATPYIDVNTIKIKYERPHFVKLEEINKSYTLYETNKCNDEKADYVIY